VSKGKTVCLRDPETSRVLKKPPSHSKNERDRKKEYQDDKQTLVKSQPKPNEVRMGILGGCLMKRVSVCMFWVRTITPSSI